MSGVQITKQTVIIDGRFCGPSDSGHGGYVSAMLAAAFDGAVEVTLRAPPPLDTPLVLERVDEGKVALKNGDQLLAEARPGSVDIEPLAAVTYEEAQEASKNFIGHRDDYDYLRCFGCGRERAPSDGLRIFPGSVGRPGVLAAPWTPDPGLADGDGLVRPEFLWSALDCPGGISGMGERSKPLLLGRYVVRLDRPVRTGEKHILMGWVVSQEGRKHYVGSALYTAAGELCGIGQATWIEPRPVG
jgi:hypothetical protein